MLPEIPRRLGIRASRCLFCLQSPAQCAAYKHLINICRRKMRCINTGQLQDVKGTLLMSATNLLGASSLFSRELLLP